MSFDHPSTTKHFGGSDIRVLKKRISVVHIYL